MPEIRFLKQDNGRVQLQVWDEQRRDYVDVEVVDQSGRIMSGVKVILTPVLEMDAGHPGTER